jgi:hypothetical protein
MPLFQTIVQEPLLKASRIPICTWQSSSLPSPEPEPCTTFCCYVQGTTADVKNNLLFEKFNINYNNLPQIFRKGSIVYRKQVREYCQMHLSWQRLVIVCHFSKTEIWGRGMEQSMGSCYLTKLKAFSCVKFYCFKPEMESLGMHGGFQGGGSR